MTKIFVADDHAVIRRGLKQILAESSEIEVVGEAGSFADLEPGIAQTNPSLLVLDLSMPGGDGVDAIKDLKKKYPELGILVLSIHSEDQYALRTLKAGASGYLTKEAAPEQLLSAVTTIRSGQQYLTPTVLKLMAEKKERKDERPMHLDLSDREFQVMLMIGQGESLTGISKKFSLSIKTISTYRNRVLKKMSMKTNADIIKYVINHSL